MRSTILIAPAGVVKVIEQFFVGSSESGDCTLCTPNFDRRLDCYFARCATVAATIGFETAQAAAAVQYSGIVNINIDHNGSVDIDDLVRFITTWGNCP